MSDTSMATAVIFLLPTLLFSAVFLPLHIKFGRPAPQRIRRPTYAGLGPNDVVIIRKP